MIPKIIHQTAKTKEIPVNWQSFQRTVQNLHPDWEYRLWTDEDNLNLVRESFPEYLESFVNMPKGIMRADVIRYMIMDQYGGMYLDLDYEFLKPFDLTNHSLVLPSERIEDLGPFVGNAVFASEKNHPFWKACLKEWQNELLKKETYIQEEDILNITGPGLLTKVYRQAFINDLTIFIPEPKAFNPLIPETKESYASLVKEKKSYGIHHCQGTWRALTFGQRIKNKIEKIMFKFSKYGRK